MAKLWGHWNRPACDESYMKKNWGLETRGHFANHVMGHLGIGFSSFMQALKW